MLEARRAMLDEFVKISAHTVQEAQDALDQLHMLEDNKPTPGQIARYALLGAVVGPTVGIGRKMIQMGGAKAGVKEYFGNAAKRGLFSKPSDVAAPVGRYLLGDMAAGATTSGAVPLIRGAMDRAAARASLKHYLAHEEEGQ
jgi:hypothetical protein